MCWVTGRRGAHEQWAWITCFCVCALIALLWPAKVNSSSLGLVVHVAWHHYLDIAMRFRAYSTDSEAELSSDDDDARRVDEEVGDASDASEDEGRRPPAPRARRRADSPISVPSASEPEESDEEPEPRRRLTVQFDPAIKSPPPTQRTLADPTLIPWAREVGVDAQKMHVMQAALFRVPEEEAALKAASRPPPRRKVSVFAGLSQKRGRDSEGEGLRTELRQVCASSCYPPPCSWLSRGRAVQLQLKITSSRYYYYTTRALR